MPPKNFRPSLAPRSFDRWETSLARARARTLMGMAIMLGVERRKVYRGDGDRGAG